MIIRIGRDPRCDYVLSNRSVSRQHATLEVSDGRIVLSDAGSRSGTFIVRGSDLVRVTYAEVTERDTLMLGSERIVVMEIIRSATERKREVIYERNPVTGEIVKR